MHRKTDSRDSVFTTIGLAMLKSTLRLAALLLVASSANAQTSRGTVTGTVLDPTGAVIAGASVTLTGVETGVRLSTNSNDAGVYRFDAVDPGTYDLTVSLPGFRFGAVEPAPLLVTPIMAEAFPSTASALAGTIICWTGPKITIPL